MKHLIAALSVFAFTAPVWAGEPAVQAEALHGEDSRFILLEGGRNFRDVGGYRTEDGKTVKKGVLYRSGSLGALTLKDQLRLRKLHIGTIVDLRTTDERSRDMSNWLAVSDQGYWTRDYGMSQGDMGSFFSDRSKLTADSMRTMMKGAYKRLPREQAPSYRVLFAKLAESKEPVVVNCTAGKDRTGIATALVLTAIGVPYETVREDFLLSNGAPGMETLQANLSSPLSSLPADVVEPLIGVEGEYLDIAFAQIREDYGSTEGYLQQELGVGPEEIAAIRARMLN
jgi:protein-tyrosine phosphatase